MNIENLDKLIAALEAAPDEKFDMQSVFVVNGNARLFGNLSDCGTAACLCGWVKHISGEDTFDDWLGLTNTQASQLAMPHNFQISELWPRNRAIATLKRLRKTGKVNWGRASKAKRSA